MTVCFIGSIVFWLVGARKISKFLNVGGVLIFLICSSPILARQMVEFLESQYPPIAIENVPQSPLIVVLGGVLAQPAYPRLLSELVESSDRILHAFRLYKAGKAPTIYLSAGIFFLLKKPFSLTLMYVALSFSILFQILPMLFLSQHNSHPFVDYSFNISKLIGPLIDVALLIGVYRISKYYFKSHEELTEIFGEKTQRKVITPRQLKIIAYIGLFCLSIPLSIFGLWIYAKNSGTTNLERTEVFQSYLPTFLHGQLATSYLSVVFCILAIILSSISLKLPERKWKTLNTVILNFSILFLLLFLFTLM